MPSSNAAYAEAAERGQAWVAEDTHDTLGLVVVADTGFSALDVHLIAVRPRAHRRGVGRSLIQACAVARDRGKAYLTVKTQGPSRDYEPYRRTRAFYEAVGFRPLEEFTSICPKTPV